MGEALLQEGVLVCSLVVWDRAGLPMVGEQRMELDLKMVADHDWCSA